MFASMGSVAKYSLSRRDDIQSLFYVMIFLLNQGPLPWPDMNRDFKGANYNFDDYLSERLKSKYSQRVMNLCPESIKEVMLKVMQLQYEEEPPYEEMIAQLKQEIVKEVVVGPNLVPKIHVFEW